ncbi:MAG: hypothetical protein IT378_19100 [Sandaracinaceae bacterium]|nr:hypothetical protein [Sandaracinaceae bacterium]
MREWQQVHDELSHTAFALATQADDESLASLYHKIAFELGQWEQLDAERRNVGREAIAARAHVRMADAALDHVLHRLAGAASEHGEHYAKLFPEGHEEVIALGLDGELPAASVAMAVLDEDGTPAPLKAHAAHLRQALAVGHGALSARADAYAARGRLEARMEACIEDGEGLLRVARTTLAQLASARGRPERWVAAFFARSC